MLQCQIWGRGTGNAGEWEALTAVLAGAFSALIHILTLYNNF
jgi:hypothetical protein